MDKKSFPIWSLLYRNIFLIVIVSIVVGAVFGVFNKVTYKPSYTASKRVVVSADLDPDAVKTSAYATNNVTLANILLPTITKNIKTQKVIDLINYDYKKDSEIAKTKNQQILASNIGISYNEESLFFTVSYVDTTEEYAKEKLDYIIGSFNTVFNKLEEMDSKVLSTGKITVVAVQNTANVTKNSNLIEKIILGVCVGLLLSVCFVVLRYLLNNKITTEEEIVAITGERVMSFIEK